MNKIILVTGSIVGYAYTCEFFIAWYSGNIYERFAFMNRAFGPYWWAYWVMFSCNAFIPQIFWFRSMRRSIPRVPTARSKGVCKIEQTRYRRAVRVILRP